jgi:hypothetical protein
MLGVVAVMTAYRRRLCRVARLDAVLAQGGLQPFQFGIEPV